MDLREYAASVLTATTVEGKLRPPAGVDESAGNVPGGRRAVALGDVLASCCPPERAVPALSRPAGLEIREGGRVRVPPGEAWPDVAQRVRILHALANHELQAAELFAWAILRFPDVPDAMRRGWLRILGDEQRHCGMYCDRLAAHGARFGDFAVSGHFWRRANDLTTPLRFTCAMGLTFESANLDFGGDLAVAAEKAGDAESARVLRAVHEDEVRHVRFAFEWLVRLKEPSQSAWEAYLANVEAPQGPSRARGVAFDRAAREAAGFDEDFIARLEATPPEAPGGARRR